MSDNNAIGLEMEDNIEGLIDQACANASMACGDGDFEKNAFQQFCKDMNRLESILRFKGIIPRREFERDIEVED